MDTSPRSFEIASCLGRGGFGEVYRARMTRAGGLSADVALKVLRRDIDPDGQAVQRLRDEGRNLARLNHPAILKVHDLLVLDGRVALVTEFVDGDDLSACLGGSRGLGPRALLQVVARVAGALHAAWTSCPPGETRPLRMVHRDIKPSNIRLSRHGDVKLLDFGIARTDVADREARTRTDMMVGSPAFMAPERFLERDVRLESDVFSLGAVLFEGLTGDRFYDDLPVPMQVGLAFDRARFHAHLDRQLARVAQPELRALLARTLAWDPSERPAPDALALEADALADALTGPTLARWCRARDWSAPGAHTGELDGRSLSEGTLERPSISPFPPTEPVAEDPVPTSSAPVAPAPPSAPAARSIEPGTTASTRRLPVVAAGVAGVSVSAALGLGAVVLVVAALGSAWWFGFGAGAPVSEPALAAPQAPEPLPDAVPEPDPVAAPDPTPAPEPVAAPAPRPRPAPADPPVVAPSPVPTPPVAATEPAPAPTGPPPGRVELDGDVVALLVIGGVETLLPADVPPGSHALRARFNGRDAIDAGRVEVTSGSTRTVSCSTRMTRCSVR